MGAGTKGGKNEIVDLRKNGVKDRTQEGKDSDSLVPKATLKRDQELNCLLTELAGAPPLVPLPHPKQLL